MTSVDRTPKEMVKYPRATCRGAGEESPFITLQDVSNTTKHSKKILPQTKPRVRTKRIYVVHERKENPPLPSKTKVEPSDFINSSSKINLMKSDPSTLETLINTPEVISGNIIRSVTDITLDKDSETNKLLNNSNKMENLPEENIKVQSETQLQQISIIDTIKTLTDSKLKPGIFKYNTLRMLLTYQKVKLNKLVLLEHISNIVKDKRKVIKDYVIIHEYCKYENVFYTHMYIRFNEAFQSTYRKVFNFLEIQPNVERILHYEPNINKVLIYLFEKDPDPCTNLDMKRINEITQSNFKFINTLEDSLSSQDEIKTPSKDNFIDNNMKCMEKWNFKPWQRFLLNVVEGEVDKRIFYWCWESMGNMGKTELTHYIESNYKHVLVIETLDNLIETYMDTIKNQP